MLHRSPLVILSLAVMLLGACMPFKRDQAPVTVYQLQPPAQGLMAQPPALPARTTLEVSQPTVPAGLDKERIALALDQGRRLDYYAGASWAENLPDVIQDIAIASLRQSLPGLSVDDDEHLPAATHRLRIDVLNFAPVYAGAATTLPQVRVTLRFALIDLRSNSIASDVTLAAVETPASNTLGAVTAALEKGLHRVLADATPRLAHTLAPPGKAKR